MYGESIVWCTVSPSYGCTMNLLWVYGEFIVWVYGESIVWVYGESIVWCAVSPLCGVR